MANSKSRSGTRAAKGYVIGRQRFAKISAIEGIQITPSMDADFREFDRQELPAGERRKLIARKYAKSR